jgi:hypothetical protein
MRNRLHDIVELIAHAREVGRRSKIDAGHRHSRDIAARALRAENRRLLKLPERD